MAGYLVFLVCMSHRDFPIFKYILIGKSGIYDGTLYIAIREMLMGIDTQ